MLLGSRVATGYLVQFLQDVGSGFNEMGCYRGTRVAVRCTGCVREGEKSGGRKLQRSLMY